MRAYWAVALALNILPGHFWLTSVMGTLCTLSTGVHYIHSSGKLWQPWRRQFVNHFPPYIEEQHGITRQQKAWNAVTCQLPKTHAQYQTSRPVHELCLKIWLEMYRNWHKVFCFSFKSKRREFNYWYGTCLNPISIIWLQSVLNEEYMTHNFLFWYDFENIDWLKWWTPSLILIDRSSLFDPIMLPETDR